MSCEREQKAVEEAESALTEAELRCDGVDDMNCQLRILDAGRRLAHARVRLSECRAAMRLLLAEGLVTFLRVHELGSGWGGGQSNFLDVEVVFKLDTQPNRAFGFQMRDDKFLPVRHGMLDILRDAMVNRLMVLVDFLEPVNPPNQNCKAVRIAVHPPTTRPSSGQVLAPSATPP